jgi:3-phenylpropionate/cinnamic acid dioxygenase small subunit
MNDLPSRRATGLEDHHEVQQFAYREAALLDRRRYREWLALVADDIVYQVSVQSVRDAADGNLEVLIVDEDMTQLKLRVEQIATPRLTHAENPATLTRRFITNLQVCHGLGPDEYVTDASLLIYLNRTGVPAGMIYAGERQDVLRRVDGGFRLARRHVRLDQAVMYGGPVSTLF